MTWEQFAVICTISGATATAVWIISRALNRQTQSLSDGLEKNRKESDEGRRSLYKTLDENMKEIRTNYVHKEVLASKLELLHQSGVEQDQQIASLRNDLERIQFPRHQ